MKEFKDVKDEGIRVQGFEIWGIAYLLGFGPVARHGLAASSAARRLPRHSDHGSFISRGP